MEDLAMYLLELLMNSIHAKATDIRIALTDSRKENVIRIVIEDNGRGMDAEMLKNFTNPFITTRNTRKIGLGVSFIHALTELCNGTFRAESKPNQGTKILAELEKNCIDVPEPGDLGQLIMAGIQANPKIHLQFSYQNDTASFLFRTDEISQMLGEDIPLDQPDILLWIRDYINENICRCKEGI